jgi:DNA gyrase subunit A
MPVSSISVISRNTQGVRLIVVDDSERVVSAARLAEEEADGDGADGADEPELLPPAPEEEK